MSHPKLVSLSSIAREQQFTTAEVRAILLTVGLEYAQNGTHIFVGTPVAKELRKRIQAMKAVPRKQRRTKLEMIAARSELVTQ